MLRRYIRSSELGGAEFRVMRFPVYLARAIVISSRRRLLDYEGATIAGLRVYARVYSLSLSLSL